MLIGFVEHPGVFSFIGLNVKLFIHSALQESIEEEDEEEVVDDDDDDDDDEQCSNNEHA